MAKSLEAWKKLVFGNVVKIDDDSADCVDVSKSWITYLTDKSWQEASGWGNAKDIYSYWSETYLDRIPRGNAPKLGDIVCMNGTVGGGFGHTGVVVAIDGQNITLYQENTFTQQPVYTGVYNAYVSYITGFLRPNANAPFTVDGAVTLQAYQRITNDVVNYRDAASRNGKILQQFVNGDTIDFKGFVHGESIDGNDIWFVGRYTGGFAWSGGFTDATTHDLADLTPTQVPLQSFQRQVGNSVINYRKLPDVQPDNVIQTFQPGEILDFDAWTHGSLVDGSDVWFRGKYTGGWAHSTGFTDQTTHDLTEVTLEVTPVPVDPTPVDLTNKVVDLSSNNKITDYTALQAAVRAVIFKAGHTGVSYAGVQPLNSDPEFAQAKAGLGDKLIGAYWYGYASLDPEVEAQAFVSTVGAVPAGFTYWLDIEESDSQTDKKVNTWVQKFCDKVDSLTNKVTGLYMNQNWYDTVITSETKTTRPIWLANYSVPENTSIVANQVAHQYTSKGSVKGVSGYVDINVVKDTFFTPIFIVPPIVPVDPKDPTPVDPTPIPDDPINNPLFKILEALAVFLTQIVNKLKKK